MGVPLRSHTTAMLESPSNARLRPTTRPRALIAKAKLSSNPASGGKALGVPLWSHTTAVELDPTTWPPALMPLATAPGILGSGGSALGVPLRFHTTAVTVPLLELLPAT